MSFYSLRFGFMWITHSKSLEDLSIYVSLNRYLIYGHKITTIISDIPNTFANAKIFLRVDLFIIIQIWLKIMIETIAITIGTT